MTTRNFDFWGHINEENRYATVDELGATEDHLTVQGLLQLKYGKNLGTAIYKSLARLAHKAAQQNGGEPGLIFTDDGGHFVSFHDHAAGDD